MAWPPKAADSREAGYIYANRYVSEASLRLQKRSGPYISRGNVLQHQLVETQLRSQPLQIGVLLLKLLKPTRLIHLQATVLLPPAVSVIPPAGMLSIRVTTLKPLYDARAVSFARDQFPEKRPFLVLLPSEQCTENQCGRLCHESLGMNVHATCHL